MSEFAKTKPTRCNDYRNKLTEKYSISDNKFFQCSNESNSRHVRSIRFTMQKLNGTPTGNLTCCCILFVTSSHCIRDKRLSFFIKKLTDWKKKQSSLWQIRVSRYFLQFTAVRFVIYFQIAIYTIFPLLES